MAKASKWDKVGELRKTRRPDMLVGHVEIKELNIKLRVVAFIRTNEQKRNKKEADIVLLLPKEKNEPDVEIAEDLFD